MRRSTRIDGSAGGEPLSCGNQSTYNRVANAGNLHRLSPFQMPFGILHNLTGKSSLTFSIEKCHFITAIRISEEYPKHLPPAEARPEWLRLVHLHPFAPCAAGKVHSSAGLSMAGNVPASVPVPWFPCRSAEIERRRCAGYL